ncbi:MAG TPA: DUF3467 domain-containing protein [Vicinamibacterales bacterium]|nr:DUF3467 domain-containing protein [Vicinamibacterales bacterium]
MNDRKQINFTIVPDEAPETAQQAPRTYANFCAIAHTPFDVTITFCEVQPLSRKDLEAASGSADPAEHVIKAPVRARIVLPLQVLPNLIGALQEQMRVISESSGGSWERGPVH